MSPIRPSSASNRTGGFSYIEIAISVAVGSIVFAAVMALAVFSSKSFAAIGNYMDLDKASRNALDLMSREIRQSRALQSYTTNQLVFTDVNTNTLTYAWNKSTGKLTRTQGGVSTILLSQCDYLNFHISQRNPMPGVFDFYAASNNASVGKLVDISWKCSRQILGKKINTESVQTAKIVIRN